MTWIEALAGVIDGLTSSGVVSAVSNRRGFRIGQEPLDLFRRYLALYAREQAYLPFQPGADRQPRAPLERDAAEGLTSRHGHTETNRPRLHPSLHPGARRRLARRCCCCTAPAATSTTSCRWPNGSRPAARSLSPRGKVNEQGITRFFRRAPDGAWDLDDLAQRTGELADFVRSARGAYRPAEARSCSAIPTAPTSAGRCC